ncbi:MAG: Pvc16 family protein [Gammaproteobacteria bacterium]|nr:Pvc16 family protein [Gammaproteobacteria bacterium]
MPLPESSISFVCNAVSDFVTSGVNATENSITVSIGPPATVASENDEHRINLFFYRFEPGGFDSVSHPNDPWRIRMFCLISVFGINEGAVMAGENDLRLLGEVMRLFQQQPVLGGVQDALLTAGEEVYLQAVFSPVSDEQINQIWSTQGDATYRPSVIYEMGLTPIIPSIQRAPPKRVGAIGAQARADNEARFAAFSGSVQGPPVVASSIDVSNPHWVPVLCWVYQGVCAYSLSFDIDSDEFAAFAAQVWLVGDSSASVELVWEAWASSGWQGVGAAVAATPFNTAIDPDNMPLPSADFPLNVVNPVSISAEENAAQGLLYAMRDVVISGRPTETVRSNPLLLSLYRSS